MLNLLKNKDSDKLSAKNQNKSFSYVYNPENAPWEINSYQDYAEEAYIKNAIAHRSIHLIASSAAHVAWRLYAKKGNKRIEVISHPLLDLLKRPNPFMAGAEFFEKLYAYKLLSGNSYVEIVGARRGIPKELYILRTDQVFYNGTENCYLYQNGDTERVFHVDPMSGKSNLLHLKTFHPLDEASGLSKISAASYAIDLHNTASKWNKSLLQNGARPSGALVVKGAADGYNHLTEQQATRLRTEIDKAFSGPKNAGKPLLLEGGLEWQEMSINPKDLDYIEAKNSSAREIALALGVPPQLLGLKGDNTYNNMQEARLALWEETILPLLDHVTDALNHSIVSGFGENLELEYDQDSISALTPRRDAYWERIKNADFMTLNEKRTALGLNPIEEGDRL